jgi:hypothetical protein
MNMFIPATALAILLPAPSTHESARGQAPAATDQTKTVLSIQRIPARNGPNDDAATMQVGVEFGHEFFFRADFAGHTLSARGIVRSGPNQSFRVRIEFTDAFSASTTGASSNLILKLDEPKTLANFSAPEKSELRITLHQGKDPAAP